MSHHSYDYSMMKDDMADLLREHLGLGATGRYPKGHLHPSDEGELRLAVVTKGDKVILSFGKPVAWIGFDPEQAEGLADLLRQHAKQSALARG